MKKKNKANLIMVAIILAIAAAGLMTVGFIQGWFGGEENAALVTEVRGVVNMTRDGVSYPVEANTALRAEDKLTCAKDATVVITAQESKMTLGAEAELTVEQAEADDFTANLSTGEAVVECQSNLVLNGMTVEQGVVSLHSANGTYIQQTYSEESYISPETMTDFQLSQLKKVDGICFTADELKQEEDRRKTQLETTAPTEREGPSPEEMTMRCTIRIVCETILDNMDKLDPAKTPYVPEDGIILDVEVPFAPGETVIDVLKRTCEQNDLHIEYSWTPLYDSYYVEGINQIYEFDCGPESGWMYKVNGWFPNYGCSDYELSGGEEIVWCYSCVGLGTDVGGSNFQ